MIPIDEHGMYFHLFMSALYFSLIFYSFQCIHFSSPWLTFISKCFFLFGAIVNVIIFLISFSDSSFLVYRNATDFCTLIFFYPTNLPNLFINSNRFFVESLRFSTYKIMSSPNRNNFTSSFLI